MFFASYMYLPVLQDNDCPSCLLPISKETEKGKLINITQKVYIKNKEGTVQMFKQREFQEFCFTCVHTLTNHNFKKSKNFGVTVFTQLKNISNVCMYLVDRSRLYFDKSQKTHSTLACFLFSKEFKLLLLIPLLLPRLVSMKRHF